MYEALTYVGAGLFPITYVIYIIAMVRSAGTEHPVQPRRLTWLGYAMLNGVALAAMTLQGKANPSAWMAFGGSVTICVATLRYGLPKIEKVDWICVAGSLVGVVLLLFTANKEAVIVIGVSAALVASVPTFVSTWQNPRRESKLAWAAGLVAVLIALHGVKDKDLVSIGQFVGFTVINGIVVAILYFRDPELVDPEEEQA